MVHKNTTHKSKDWEAQTPLKTGSEQNVYASSTFFCIYAFPQSYSVIDINTMKWTKIPHRRDSSNI